MMRQFIFSCICIVLLLVCGVVHAQTLYGLSPAPATPQNQMQLTEQQQAIFDAHNDVQQYVSGTQWFLAGACCGIFTFAYAVIDTPSVPTPRLLGKSPAYIAIYTTEYQAKAKSKRIRTSALGWGTFALLYFAYLASAY